MYTLPAPRTCYTKLTTQSWYLTLWKLRKHCTISIWVYTEKERVTTVQLPYRPNTQTASNKSTQRAQTSLAKADHYPHLPQGYPHIAKISSLESYWMIAPKFNQLILTYHCRATHILVFSKSFRDGFSPIKQPILPLQLWNFVTLRKM